MASRALRDVSNGLNEVVPDRLHVCAIKRPDHEQGIPDLLTTCVLAARCEKTSPELFEVPAFLNGIRQITWRQPTLHLD